MNAQARAIASFESEKNKKAFTYTLLICGAFLLLAILYTWPSRDIPKPVVVQDLIEINLGNEMEGEGQVQPLVKGDPAPEQQTASSPVKENEVKDEPAKEIAANENDDDPDAAEIKKPLTPVKEAKTLPKQTMTKAVKTSNTQPQTNPTPAQQKPKLPLYKGGTGTGGNGAAEDNGYRNQGYKKGNGDMGSPNGNPDSYGSNPGGRAGVSVVRGRKPIRFPNMQADHDENAKVYVDVKIDQAGNVTSAAIAKGTTTSKGSIRSIALEKARQLKFPASDDDVSTSTILFNFVLNN
jgi:outer membrane biosynthesis protein TonB